MVMFLQGSMTDSAYMARATFFVNISQKKLVLSTKAAKNASRFHQFSRLFEEKIDDDLGFYAFYQNLEVWKHFSQLLWYQTSFF